MPIKTLLFDIDRVLAKNDFSISFSERFSKDFNIPIEDILSFLKNEYEDCKIGKKDLVAELERKKNSWNYNLTPRDLLTYWYTPDSIKINNELMYFIKNLRNKGIKCYTCSNNEKYRGLILFEKLNLKNNFDGNFFSYELGSKKPSEMYYSTILNALEAQPSELLLIDDKGRNILDAKEMGIQGHLYENNETLFKDLEVLF